MTDIIVLSQGKLVALAVCEACGAVVYDEAGHARWHGRQRDRDGWVRWFNDVENAVTHHRRDKLAGVDTSDEVDERLWAARDRALRRAAGLL